MPPSIRERPGVLLAVVLTGQAMASMDGSIVTVALPSIQRDLGASAAALQLIVSGYLLTLGVLIVTGARLGDLLTPRRAFLIGLAGFTAASLLCGLAPAAPALVVARVVQAAAAALMIPQVFALIQVRFTGAAQRRAIGLYSMVLALGVALGQMIGGLVVGIDLFGLSWRPAFLINIPVGAALMAVGLFALPRSTPTARRLDLAGVALLTVAMAALVAPLVFGREDGWRPWTWLSLLAGVALLAAFGRLERLVAARGGTPLLDLDVWRPRGVKPGLAACFLVMGCYAAFLFAFTLHLQADLGFDPLGAGLAFVPYAIGFATLSLTWAHLPVRARTMLPVAGPVVFAAVALIVAVFAATSSSPGWPAVAMAPLLFAAGVGHAAGYSPLIAHLSAVIGPGRASALSALNSTGPMLSSVIAIAGLGSLFLTAGLTWTLTAVAVLLLLAAAPSAWASMSRARPEPAPVTQEQAARSR
ncbi:MFS transporter [Streptosporangiaceae bacterium NEAU-GS5]|nr:MFS transporter [Streptosporangiaceae bacterium NEAU-GS5]